jgi:hypothetical protein
VNTTHKLLLGASAVVFAAGTVVAIVQPGDLGDDDVASTAPTSTTASTTTTTSVEVTTSIESTTLTTAAGTSTTSGATATTTHEPATSTTAPSGVTTTTAASGLGASGAGNPNTTGETAETGGREMLGLGLLLGALGLAGRRIARQSS